MRDLGSIQSPQNAFILNLGLESLHVRVKRHCENALAEKYLPNGSCGVYPDLVRYSCGIEDAEDLIADLAQALEQIE